MDQIEAMKTENIKQEKLQKKRQYLEKMNEAQRHLKTEFGFPCLGTLRKMVIEETDKSKYSIYPGSTKTYRELKQMYWWPNMKPNVAKYISECSTCAQVKFEHQASYGQL